MPPTHTNCPISVNPAQTQQQHQQNHDDESDYKLIQRNQPSKSTQQIDENNDATTSQIPLIDRVFPVQIVWRNVALFTYLHLSALVGGYLLITGQVMFNTFLWGALFYFMSGLGITAGCHRYWSHKSYKAKTPLRLLLALFQTIAVQNSIHEWSRDHRVHHKYSETNADPHNAKRGFFFAHMGWLLSRKHPAVKAKGAGVDMSDLEADKIVMFQKKYYLQLVLLFCFIIPSAVPVLVWGESFFVAWFFVTQFRFCVILHWTWLVNSAAHLWGDRPYDKNINPSENKMVAVLAMGEGWHNYHHTFPWDYKTAELGFYQYNLTTAFIDMMAKIGWAYDLKTVPKNIVKARVARTGDGSWANDHYHHHETSEVTEESHVNEEVVDHGHGGPWGWGDKDIPEEDVKVTEILNKLPSEEQLNMNNNNTQNLIEDTSSSLHSPITS